MRTGMVSPKQAELLQFGMTGGDRFCPILSVILFTWSNQLQIWHTKSIYNKQSLSILIKDWKKVQHFQVFVTYKWILHNTWHKICYNFLVLFCHIEYANAILLHKIVSNFSFNELLSCPQSVKVRTKEEQLRKIKKKMETIERMKRFKHFCLYQQCTKLCTMA